MQELVSALSLVVQSNIFFVGVIKTMVIDFILILVVRGLIENFAIIKENF